MPDTVGSSGFTNPRITGGVLLAVMAVSAAAIFIRLADAPALSLAFYRNLLAIVVLAPLLVMRRERLPSGAAMRRCLWAGFALAVHFALWIESLRHTTVAASVVLVCTQPIFVALMAQVWLREPTPGRGWIGIGIALAGTACIAGVEQAGARTGNLMALGGAVAVAFYVLFGRQVRGEGIAIVPYSVVVYGSAAWWLGLACVFLRVPLTGFSGTTWGMIAALTLGPQILGHTLFNWALKHVPAASLSGTILLEPLVSTLLAWVFLSETPMPMTFIGGAFVLLGLGLLVFPRPRPPR